ncbi:hypothetical protein [Rhizobium sp. SL86]|uniref:hypothetical protein n=1 Tax=Rhizobium sp. SL86 TaxID=2995148 RepID=UPI0022758451|nr:hypothetical protein [Rhizobium sp. SL86]MCY1669179.1 hypothetical protein [Rhizobium sp. SL86]
MPTYSLTFQNDDKLSHSWAIFQKNPALYPPNHPFSLAWVVGPGQTGAGSSSAWNADYRFNPTETTVLKPATQPFSSVAPNNTAVGIGMAGSGTFVTEAQPNMTAPFIPYPTYWMIFGNFETGEVMDVQVVDDKTP